MEITQTKFQHENHPNFKESVNSTGCWDEEAVWGQAGAQDTDVSRSESRPEEKVQVKPATEQSSDVNSEYKNGKVIGGRIFSENDIKEYQRNMKGRRLFFSNLSFETTWKHVKDHMRQAGDVVRVDIFQDDKGRSKGCGVVEFRQQEDCSKALQTLHQSELHDRQIFLKYDTSLHPMLAMNYVKNRDSAGQSGHQERKSSSSNRVSSSQHLPEKDISRSIQKRSRSRENTPAEQTQAFVKRRGLKDQFSIDNPAPQQRFVKWKAGFAIRIDNLPFDIDNYLLAKAFREFGNVEQSQIVDNDERNRGIYGFVEFDSQDSAIQAVKVMDRARFNGRVVNLVIIQ